MAGAANAQGQKQRQGGGGEKTLRRLLERLRELRRASGLTQEAFSEAAGISYKYYQAVEAGRKRELRLSTLVRLAQAHGLELWELLAPAKPKTAAPRRKKASERKTK